MRYSYDNSNTVKDYQKRIRYGFKRFHSMNAQERIMTLEDTNDANITVLQFVSYNTNIMQATINHKYNTITIACNGDPFNWSLSTSRQLARYLLESKYLPFDAARLRTAYENCKGVTPDVSVYEYFNITFEFRSSYSFNSIWR